MPHWQPPEDTFFITYRLFGSIPLDVIDQLKRNYTIQKNHPDNQTIPRKGIIREEYFDTFENAIEKNLNEPHWLKDDAVAAIIMNSLFFNNNKQYILWCACLMSNHVHIIISTLPGSPLLNVILQNHKKFTAVQSNKLLDRSGKFWAEESFDTLIRNNAHYFRAASYCIQNPVKAGLVKNWTDWKWTYLHPELDKEFRFSVKKH
jgi:REP element-mobilizing transposase RayT